MIEHRKCEWCGHCHICHEPQSCTHWGRDRAPIEARTQKAIGLTQLFDRFSWKVTEILGLFRSVEEINQVYVPSTGLCHSVFVRPCPIRPRHGFVESFPTTSMLAIRKAVEATLEADPQGEVIITRAFDADYNFIWTPRLLTVGKGHDGATAGRDTISLPLAGVITDKLREILDSSGVGANDDPYIEGVVKGSRGFLTQLRAGPRLTDIGVNYIPYPVVVEKIVKAEGSLLEWEKIICLCETGTVVHHLGGSLTDHYTVHARSFNIPVILEGDVSVGDILTPTSVEPRPSLDAVMKGLVVGGTFPITYDSRNSNKYVSATTPLLALLLTSLHHSTVMGGENGKWIGFAAAMMARLGATALRGEARYLKPHNKRGGRPQVYAGALNRSLSRQRSSIAPLTNLLMFGNFNAGMSVGGPKWARCGGALTRLFTAIGEFAREPSDEGVGELLRSLNDAVNQAHNGGWWMNKFGSHELFTDCQEGCPHAIGLSSAALMETRELFSSITDDEIKRQRRNWARWPETIISPIKLRGALVRIWPGAGLEITLESSLFKGLENGPRILHIPIDWSKAPSMLSEISVLPIEGGVQIVHQTGKEKSTIIWEDSISKFAQENAPTL